MKKDKKRYDVEVTDSGFANGISTQLAQKIAEAGNTGVKLTQEEKDVIVEEAAIHFGSFLTALGVEWEGDPNSSDTPRRVAKAYVNDLWKGRFEPLPDVTAFPSDGYDGIVQESNIPLTSMCSHHHQTITGRVSVAYIPGPNGQVVGLSKLNRIVEHFGRRGAIQEQLTVAIHSAIHKICEGNVGVAVQIDAGHNCVSCRGTKHQGASMQTAKLSGNFRQDSNIRAEFFNNIAIASRNK
tara:strand:- start:1 stop:717 length:717 start_codon:yes stop_codon:yes gene_type:complete